MRKKKTEKNHQTARHWHRPKTNIFECIDCKLVREKMFDRNFLPCHKLRRVNTIWCCSIEVEKLVWSHFRNLNLTIGQSLVPFVLPFVHLFTSNRYSFLFVTVWENCGNFLIMIVSRFIFLLPQNPAMLHDSNWIQNMHTPPTQPIFSFPLSLFLYWT